MSNQQTSTASRPWLAHSVWLLPVVLLATLVALLGLGQNSVSANTAPAISLDKSIDGGLTEAPVGATITYTLKVTNSGNVPLQTVSVVDTQCTVGAATKTGGDTDDDLEVGELWTYKCVVNTTGKTPGSFANTATVTAKNGTLTVQASDTATLTLLNTGVHVTKTLDAGQDPIVQGETVNFTIVVRNTSAITIAKANVSLVDSVTPGGATCAPLTGPTESHPASVDQLIGSANGLTGETWTYTCAIANVLDDFTNTVVVTTKNAAGQTVGTHSASAAAKVLNPGLVLEKSADKTTVTTGETVKWTFKLWNTGEVTLTVSAAGIVDTKCTPITPSSASVTLNPGAQQSYTCSRSYAAGDVPADGIIKNTATVTANTTIATVPASLGQLVKSATGQVTVLKPGLEVNKTPLVQTVAQNGTAKFTITAKNTGQGDLSTVTIEDPMCTSGTLVGPTGDNGDNKINPGETFTWTCEKKNVTADFTNVVIVRAKDASGIERSGINTAYVDVVNPGINIAKGTVEGATVTIPDTDLTVNYGMTATFQLSVTNKGDTELSTVNVTDLQCPVTKVDANNDGFIDGDTDKDNKLDTTETWVYRCAKGNVSSDFENVASVSAVDVLNVTQSATSGKVKVNVNRPDLRLTKKANVPFVEEGKAISWTLTISNVGQLDLTVANTTTTNFLIDPICKTLTPTSVASNTLAKGAAWVFICTADPALTFMNDEIKNTATAIFKSGSATIIDTDSATVQVYRNSLNLEKAPRSSFVLKGADAIFDFSVSVVSRPGTPAQTLSDVMVEDALCPGGKATYKSGDNGDGKLQSTEVWSFECTVAKVETNLTNTAKASAKDANGRTVSDIDSAVLSVINAQLTVKKSTGTPIVNPGANVTFDIEVSNTGDNNLINVVVTDTPTLGACQGGSTLTRISGDTNNDSKLNKGETWKYACTINNVQNDTTNTVSVSSKDEVSGLTIPAGPVAAAVSVLRPGINLEKTPDTQTIVKGSNAIFELKVSNTGNTDITSVNVTDDLCAQQPVTKISGDTDGDSVLDKGETWVYPCTVVAVAQNLINSAAVTGVSNGQALADTDTASVTVTEPAAPAIDVTKSGPATATAGSSVTFQIGVRNAGNVALTNVVPTDALCTLVPASLGNGDTTLDIGEQWNYTCTVSNVVAGTLSNTASATAQGPAGQVSDSATATVVVTSTPPPSCTGFVLSQVGDPTSVTKGGSVSFKYTICNGTAENLTNVSLKVTGVKVCKTPARLADAPGNNDSILNSGETWQYACTESNVKKTFTSKAKAQAKRPNNQKVTSSSSVKITVTTSKRLTINSVAADVTVQAGAAAGLAINVSNSDVTDLANVTVANSACASAPTLVSNGNGDEVLSAGESWTYTCTVSDIQAEVSAETDVTAVDVATGSVEEAGEVTVIEVVTAEEDAEETNEGEMLNKLFVPFAAK